MVDDDVVLPIKKACSLCICKVTNRYFVLPWNISSGVTRGGQRRAHAPGAILQQSHDLGQAEK